MSSPVSLQALLRFGSNPAPSKPVFAMPRASLLGLLVTMVACFLPHASRLPVWMWLAAAACVIYRLLVLVQRANYPGALFKFTLAIVGTWLLLREYGTLMAPDGGVAFLLLGYFLKMLEMHYRRDAMVLMLLSFFVIPMQFLYETGFFGSLWVLFCFLLIIATLVSFHQQNDSMFRRQAFSAGAKLMGWAVPLTVVLFLFFPRLPPFWHLPSSKPAQTIGLTDQMDLQNLGELFKSGKVAFRAEFQRTNPDRRQLYWRGVVMERFDGVSWSVRENRQTIPMPGKSDFDTLDYRVFLEPTQQRYVFFLSPLSHMSGVTGQRYENEMVMTETPIISQMIYQAGMGVDIGLTRFSSNASLQDNLLLPINVAPRTRVQSAQLFENAGRDPDAFIRSLQTWIFTEGFSYTLSPPVTSGDVIDDFLFRTRAGYCSHYASAAAVMLRSAGIPARVIGGYQGGEYQASGNYWIVHQYDAHAWVEYFHPENGWTVFDPTAAISPLRIESGMEQMSRSEAGGMFESYAINQWPVLREIRRGLDYLNYQWIVNVVGYQQQDRDGLLKSWFGGTTIKDWLPWFAGTSVAMFGVFWLFMWWRDRPAPLHPLDKIMLQVLDRAARRFRPRKEGETVASFCRAYADSHATGSSELLALCDQYHRLRYRYEIATSPAGVAKTESVGNVRLRSSLADFKRRAKLIK